MDFATFSGFTNTTTTSSLLDNDNKTNHGSGFHKQQRSDPVLNDDQQSFLRSSKTARTDSLDPFNKMRSDSLVSVSSGDNMLLNFSSSSSKNANQSSLFSFYQPPPAYIRNAGYGYGGMQVGVSSSRYKGPFSPSQWMELEHQALIYKHLVANVPLPSHLLNPLNPFLYSSTPSYSYGWETLHLGLSRNTDPEPGRCRRTDGKKWRCSREAVPDQKYCERHINRGRHRSRKPVETQNGPSKVAPLPPPTDNNFKTFDCHESQQHSVKSPSTTLRSKDSLFSIPKQQNTIKESSDSLTHSSQKTPYVYPSNPLPYSYSIYEGSKHQFDRGSVTWPEEPKADWTQLSMSIPMVSSDFSSSSNSPAQEKLTLAPLTLPDHFDFDLRHKQAPNLIPVSWENSMGGPLGEVLNRTSSSSEVKSKNGSSNSELKQMGEMWDLWGSSPTGVLQKTSFVSLSNSSSGSSPGGNKGRDGGGEMFLSTPASSSSFPPSS